MENSGYYYAQLTNDAGTMNTNKAELVVNKAPVFEKVPEPLNPLKKDETLTLEVVVTGNPKPTISWILNGKEFTAKDGVQINKNIETNTYTLTIPNINPSIHYGKIVIKASNVVDTIQHEISLDVLGEYYKYNI